MAESNTYHIVYKTTNLVNSKYYIGVHSTNKLDDGYIGCGIHTMADAFRIALKRHKLGFVGAVLKYGYANFSRDILALFDNRADAYNLEIQLVTPEVVKSKNSYNLALGGRLKGNPSKADLYHNELLRLYLDRIKPTEIAKIFGVSPETVSHWLRPLKLSHPLPHRYVAISPERVEFLFTDMTNFGRPLGIPRSGIQGCINGRYSQYKSWTFQRNYV